MMLALSPDSRIEAFLTEEGSVVHVRGIHSWGSGTACSSDFVRGEPLLALVREVGCAPCLDLLPSVWEIRTPDKRTTEGYRVLMSGISTEEVARHFAEKFDQRRSSSAAQVEVVSISMSEYLEAER